MKCSILLFLCLFLGYVSPAKVDDIHYLEPLHSLNLNLVKRGEALQFRAHNKDFVLNLVPNSELFRSEASFTYHKDGQVHQFEYDTSNFYTGEGLVDQEQSHFSLRIDWEKNHLTGIIKAGNESFGVEPAEHFYDEEKEFQTVIYKAADIKQQQTHSCGVLKHEARTPLTVQVEKRQTRDTCTVAMVADSRLFEFFGRSLIDTANNLVDVLAGSEIIFRRQSVAGFQLATVTIFADAATDPFRAVSTAHNTFLDKLNSIKSTIQPTAKCVVHARTYYNFQGILGYAQVGAICGNGGAAGITTANSFGRTSNMFTQINAVAHEIGHNFGANHDSSSNNLMYPSLSDTTDPQFSSISLQSIRQVIAARPTCLIAKSTAGIGKCGNGVMDDGEQCDCGTQCSTSQFCTSACQLKSGYQCDPSNGECCSASGQFMPKGTQCSPAPYPGVSAPTCSGTSGKCPSCYPGGTHPCDKYSNLAPCDYAPCKAGCVFTGQTQCYPATAISGITQANLPDGTCCPGGTCRSGVCIVTNSILASQQQSQSAQQVGTNSQQQQSQQAQQVSATTQQQQQAVGTSSEQVIENAITMPIMPLDKNPVSQNDLKSKENKTPLIVILAPAVGGGALLCIVISAIVAVVLVRRRKNEKPVDVEEISSVEAVQFYGDAPMEAPTLPTQSIN
jgi:DNA-binding protein H-NS